MDALFGTALIALGVVIYWGLLRRTDDALHPLGVFAGLWLGIFGFAHFNVPRTFDAPYYAEPFSATTYVVVLGSLALFAVGFWLVDPGAERLDRSVLRFRMREGVAWPRLRAVTLGLFAAASLMTAYFVRRAGEIPLFSPRSDELRQVFKLPLLGYVYDLHYAVALFATMIALQVRGRAQKAFWLVVAAASVLQLMFAGVRVSPMPAMAWAFIYMFYQGTRARLRHLVIAAVAAGRVFGVIESYRRTMYVVNPALVNPRLDLGPAATAWAHTAASFKNLQFTLQRGASPLNMGLNSYDLPKTLDPAARAVDDQLSYMYGTHNTPTYLSILYFDFGVGGLVIMPLVYGALAAFVYRKFRSRANIFWLVVYIDFLLAVVLSFRTHRFLGNSLIWFGGVAVAVQLLAGRSLEGRSPDEEVGEGSDADDETEPAGAWEGTEAATGVRMGAARA
ncbi:MAG: oligosaccharide repeat unit polymerase [Gemmatimonadetes bacterium]|nr:oligosaccharide repeat unit polymerase [Gemmatimonadota bacterium]